jgi:hypothetical protein
MTGQKETFNGCVAMTLSRLRQSVSGRSIAGTGGTSSVNAIFLVFC